MLRDTQFIRMRLHPTQRQLSTLLDHFSQAPRQHQLTGTTGNKKRLDRQDPAFAHARYDKTVNDTPPFVALAAALPGPVTLGLNRQLDNMSASLAAAVLARERMGNLYAIELGNEPECEC